MGSSVQIPNHKGARMDKHTTKSVFKEYLLPFDSKFVFKQISLMNLDQYIKKLNTSQCAKLFIYSQIHQLGSYTDISLELDNNDDLREEIGLESISISQLSRRFRDLNPDFYDSVFHDLVRQIHRELGTKKANEALGRINLIDSSTISMCLSQYRWADFRGTKAGIKMHTRIVYDPEEDEIIPDQVILSEARPADKTKMDHLIVRSPEALNVFDRGYLNYKKFDEYCDEGIRFVSRSKSNTIYTVLEELPVEPNTPFIREAVVRLGNPSTYQMRHPLRLIETMDREGNRITIITNDMKMSPQEISDVYRYRWQIELFFKWCKQHLHIKKFYGHSRAAVYNQIRIALITFCLTLLLKNKIAYTGTLWTLFKLIRIRWSTCLPSFVQMLHRNPERTSKGRKKWDHERIFQETLEQFERDETEHLFDLIYDPVH